MTKRKIIISDIHGCFYTFQKLLNKVQYEADKDILILLGDYVDRGKNTCELVAYIRQLQNSNKDNVICLKGNHEEMMCYALENKYDMQLWKSNGGAKTRKSYFRNDINIFKDYIWLRNLPYYYQDEQFTYCHSGMPKAKLCDCTNDDFIWSRDWINTMSTPTEKQVVFGHTPSSKGVYKSLNGNICIDTACVFGYQLTAMVVDDDIKYVDVNKDERD